MCHFEQIAVLYLKGLICFDFSYVNFILFSFENPASIFQQITRLKKPRDLYALSNQFSAQMTQRWYVVHLICLVVAFSPQRHYITVFCGEALFARAMFQEVYFDRYTIPFEARTGRVDLKPEILRLAMHGFSLILFHVMVCKD